MMTQSKRRTFAPQFKLKCAPRVLDQRYAIRAASAAMGVSKSVMERWGVN
ncbi:MAG: hypothetical protein ACRCT2_16370 [Plesiomonas shigelloides]